jgi:SEC-C motif-containing protein
MSKLREEACPCGRGQRYEACCGRFHQGAEPEQPRDLMAARYSAFVLGDAAFLHRTLHPQHDDHAAGVAGVTKALRAQAKSVRYQSLRILDSREPDASGAAQVLFHVSVRASGRDVSFVERSYFLHDGVGWRYLAGETGAARDVGAAVAELDIAGLRAPAVWVPVGPTLSGLWACGTVRCAPAAGTLWPSFVWNEPCSA